MITAHIPSGYALGRLFGWRGAVLLAAVVGATFPDLDLLWFYLVDNRAFHHHRYWVHAPAFAVGVSALLIAVTRASRLVVAFAAGWCLHIVLDAPVGGIMWLWPINDTLYTLITVPPTRSHWLLSFLTHWSMVFELAVWAIAAALIVTRRTRQ